MRMDIISVISELTAGSGASGEEDVLRSAESLLGKFGNVKKDALGNLSVTVGEGKTHILLDAHIDRIGLAVTSVDSSGFLRVDKCGGCDARVLSSSDVIIWGSKPLHGVITGTPPHLASDGDADKAPSFDEIFVDTGLSGAQAEKYISPGDRVTVNAPVTVLRSGRIAGAALDDTAGAAAVLRVLDICKDKKPKVKITALFSVQEETTEAGAKTGAFSAAPDEAIAVDVSFALAPCVDETQGAHMGKGAMICVSPSLSAEMSRDLTGAAQRGGIPYQTEVCPSSSGTNADVIATCGAGIKTGLVSIPIRNMHTQAEAADISDIESAARIIAAYISERGEKDYA